MCDEQLTYGRILSRPGNQRLSQDGINATILPSPFCHSVRYDHTALPASLTGSAVAPRDTTSTLASRSPSGISRRKCRGLAVQSPWPRCCRLRVVEWQGVRDLII